MITVEELKAKLRISHNFLDDSIGDDMISCLLDLARVGVNTSYDNKLIDKAIELYCKADLDHDGKGDSYKVKYEQLRDAMSLCEHYKEA